MILPRRPRTSATTAVAGADVGTLIQSVFDTLRGLGSDEPATAVELTPAVPVKRSVTDDYIVCLEDGKKLKMLKRHLMTAYGMTPEAYRAKWGLEPDDPMVAPNYSAQRQIRGADWPRPQAGPAAASARAVRGEDFLSRASIPGTRGRLRTARRSEFDRLAPKLG